MSTVATTINAAASGTFAIGGDLPIHRLGFGAMRITGSGSWGEPKNHEEAIKVLERLPEIGINFIDTADSYGPEVSERLIAEALVPKYFVITHDASGCWNRVRLAALAH